jgi:hypothetical protein
LKFQSKQALRGRVFHLGGLQGRFQLIQREILNGKGIVMNEDKKKMPSGRPQSGQQQGGSNPQEQQRQQQNRDLNKRPGSGQMDGDKQRDNDKQQH